VAPRWHRLDLLDARSGALDGQLPAAPEEGLVAFPTDADRKPSLRIDGGVVVELDSRAQHDFDLIDRFIASHGIDVEVAEEAMAVASIDAARMLVDLAVPRRAIHRLARGWTPAKLAEIVSSLDAAESIMASRKMRVRRSPSIQAHVTNRLDDPALLAADAATAVAFGFREIETTVPVAEHAAAAALAILIGSQVGVPGAITQCAIEEAAELDLGMRGLTTYAETISLYGTDSAFTDGDDTPWSKAFLTSAYASRGLKMRVTSGAGAEVLMGAAEGSSMASLESRCVSLAWAIGAEGVQNGGIDGASVAGAVPNGFRELFAENLMVMIRGLESCSGNDTLVSESDLRRMARTMPTLLAGSDFLFSGFGSILRHDNMFGPSNMNGDDLDDYLTIQRDWGFDGVLRWPGEGRIMEVRQRAAEACATVWYRLGLGLIPPGRVNDAVEAASSRDLSEDEPHAVSDAARTILDQRVSVLDAARALLEGGYRPEAEALLAVSRHRLSGELLAPSAILDESMNVLSAYTEPNDYMGPGSGYRISPRREAEMASTRRVLDPDAILAEQVAARGSVTLRDVGPAGLGTEPDEVVIGVSPAFGRDLNLTLSGLSVGEALSEILGGIAEVGARVRVVRIMSTVDVGLIGLTAARLAGSGIGIGIQSKGTSVIHRRDLKPLQNLELYSVAPILDGPAYRRLGRNAAEHALGGRPIPVQNPYTDEAITARYHARVVTLMRIERAAMRAGSPPIELEVDFDG
jgi:propanediol dehydratase large subunit